MLQTPAGYFLRKNMPLTEQEKQRLIQLIEQGKPLPAHYLVPMRCVGINAVRAAVCLSTRRVDTAFPRGAWERDNRLALKVL
jgi:hypothetical protein